MKKVLLKPYRYVRFLQYFLANYKPIGIGNLVWCLFNGFFPKNFILFGLQSADRSLFVNDFEENFRISRLNRNTEILNNKLIFPEIVGSFFIMPQTFALIYAGRFLPYRAGSAFDEASAINHLNNGKPLILKPIDGDGGIGIFKITCETAGQYYWNGEKKSVTQLRELFSTLNNYMLSDFVSQAEYSNAIFSNSVNTIRLLTMVDHETGIPFIGAAAHRIGNSTSAPVDNCAMGGFTAPIDPQSGRIGVATATKFKSMIPPRYTHHPDSGALIESVMIPHWNKLCEEIIALHTKLNFISYIGWDIVAGENGQFFILEGNDCADLKLHQAHQPLLQDPAVKAFYTFHKVIS